MPNEPLAELQAQEANFNEHGRALLSDYLELELRERERVLAENETWVAVVPLWAVWPFEMLLLPRERVSDFAGLSAAQRDGLAAMLKTITAGYNRVFDRAFPYSMRFHPPPADDAMHPEWMLHAHSYPPLLLSAMVRKFMVGFELLGSPQRDITPEGAAETLRPAIARQTDELGADRFGRIYVSKSMPAPAYKRNLVSCPPHVQLTAP